MKTYEDGLNDAWEAARKIACLPSDDGYSASKLIKIFGVSCESTILRQKSAAEAIDAIETYERFNVGDEVTDWNGEKGVITRISSDCEYIVVVLESGIAIRWKRAEFKKTGRHFSQIEEVLKQMKEKE